MCSGWSERDSGRARSLARSSLALCSLFLCFAECWLAGNGGVVLGRRRAPLAVILLVRMCTVEGRICIFAEGLSGQVC